MKKKDILGELENVADHLEITVIYDRLSGQGGYCWAKEKHYIIINNSLSVERKIELLIDGLVQFPLDQIYIKPKIREIIEKNLAVSKK